MDEQEKIVREFMDAIEGQTGVKPSEINPMARDKYHFMWKIGTSPESASRFHLTKMGDYLVIAAQTEKYKSYSNRALLELVNCFNLANELGAMVKLQNNRGFALQMHLFTKNHVYTKDELIHFSVKMLDRISEFIRCADLVCNDNVAPLTAIGMVDEQNRTVQ